MTTMLEQAVAEIRAGNIEKARLLLIEFLKQNPQSEDAWLWMTRCVTDTEQKKYCFEKVLKVNPQNQYAIRGLQRLNAPVSANTQPKIKPVVQQPVPQSQPKKSNSTVVILAGLGLLGFLCLCGIVLSSSGGGSNSSSPTRDESGGSSMAYIMCQQFIEERLVAPATAEFPPKSDIETFTVRDKKDAYQIRGYVDSENRMGAFIRNRYICEVSYVGDDRWRLDYLDFEE